jgi:hypothetical protein
MVFFLEFGIDVEKVAPQEVLYRWIAIQPPLRPPMDLLRLCPSLREVRRTILGGRTASQLTGEEVPCHQMLEEDGPQCPRRLVNPS